MMLALLSGAAKFIPFCRTRNKYWYIEYFQLFQFACAIVRSGTLGTGEGASGVGEQQHKKNKINTYTYIYVYIYMYKLER